MKLIINALLTLLCVGSLPVSRAQEVFPPEFKQVEAYMRCAAESIPDECRSRLPERFDTPFARVARGYAVLFGPYKKGINEVEVALKDFQWAADRGYFPAYEGIAMAIGRTDRRDGLEWLKKAVESGMSGAANYLTDHRGPGRNILSQEDYLVYTCIAAHPAAIESTDFLRDMGKFPKQGIPASAALRTLVEESLRKRAEKKRENFASICAADDPFFWEGSPEVVQKKQEQVRKRITQTLKGIKLQLGRYPELRWFSSPDNADLDLLPTFKPKR